MGFTKYKLVDMVKIDERFEYCSVRKDNKDKEDQLPENPFNTATFKKDFIIRLTKDIRTKYQNLSN